MNKLEASFVLLSVTFFWGIQYIFLGNIPDGISTFAFLTLTNAIGFGLVASVFFKEFSRVTKKLVWKSFLTAVLLFGFNVFLTMGSRSLDTSTASFLAAAYIIFIPAVMVAFRKKIYRRNVAGVLAALFGIFLATGLGSGGGSGNGGFAGIDIGILYLLGADIFFAVYIVLLEELAGDLSPVLLSMGQMFFGALFGLAGWLVVQPETMINLPVDPQFWASVLVIAVFIRGFTTVMQVYAQRYVSALHASLIFSMEIIFTLISMQFLPALLGETREPLTVSKVCGCLVIIAGALVSEGVICIPPGTGGKRGNT